MVRGSFPLFLLSMVLTVENFNDSTMYTFSSTPAGTTMGRKDNECGQMGVTMMAGTEGWIMEAPAATAYAVLPVGVDTMRPAKQHCKPVQDNQVD